jgi:hypothetical protein
MTQSRYEATWQKRKSNHLFGTGCPGDMRN